MLFGYGREIQNNFFIITNNNLPVNGVLKSIKYDLDNCNYGNVQCALKYNFFNINRDRYTGFLGMRTEV